ncbi:MAG: hypothetical protein QOH01_3108 [Verrucomicrobiota bacterium]
MRRARISKLRLLRAEDRDWIRRQYGGPTKILAQGSTGWRGISLELVLFGPLFPLFVFNP